MFNKLREQETIEVTKEPIESVKIISSGSEPLTTLVAHRNKGAAIYKFSSNAVNDETKIVKSFNMHKKPVRDAIYSPIGDKVITVSGTTLNIIDRATGDVSSFYGHSDDITCLAINKENNKIVTGSRDRSFILWNVKGEKIAQFRGFEYGHKGWINCIEFIPGTDDLVVTGSEDGTIKFWDIKNSKLIRTFVEGKLLAEDKIKNEPLGQYNTDNSVKSVSFTGDGTFMIYGGNNGKCYVVDVTHNELFAVHELNDKIFKISCSDSSPCYSVAIPTKVFVYNMMSNDKLADFTYSENPGNYCYGLSFSGSQLILGLFNGTIKRLELSSV